MSAQSRLDHRFNDIFSLRNTLRYSHVDRDSAVTNATAILPSTCSTATARSAILQESILSNQTDLTAKFDTWGFKHTSVTGARSFRARHWIEPTTLSSEYRSGKRHQSKPVRQYRGMSRSVSLRADGHDAFGFGIYAADQIKLNEYFDIVGGVRWDYFDNDFDTTTHNTTGAITARSDLGRTDKMWSYRGGLVFHPTPSQSYYFSYGPSFNPSAEGHPIGRQHQGTPPEKNRTFEIGGKWNFFDGALSLQGARISHRQNQCP